jgi:hypothetical protein
MISYTVPGPERTLTDVGATTLGKHGVSVGNGVAVMTETMGVKVGDAVLVASPAGDTGVGVSVIVPVEPGDSGAIGVPKGMLQLMISPHTAITESRVRFLFISFSSIYKIGFRFAIHYPSKNDLIQ